MTKLRTIGIAGTIVIASGLLYTLAASYGLRMIERAYSCIKVGAVKSVNTNCVSGLKEEEIVWSDVDEVFRNVTDAPTDGSEKVVRYSAFQVYSFVIVVDKNGGAVRKIPTFE